MKTENELHNDIKGCGCKWPICPECEEAIEKIYRLNQHKTPPLFFAPVRARKNLKRSHGSFHGRA